MQIEKYSDRLTAVVQAAQALALRSGHQQFTPLHLLKGLLDDDQRLAGNLIDAAGGTASQVALAVDRELAKLPKVEGRSGTYMAILLAIANGPAMSLSGRLLSCLHCRSSAAASGWV